MRLGAEFGGTGRHGGAFTGVAGDRLQDRCCVDERRLRRTGFEPVTFGSVDRCSDSATVDGATTYGDVDPALTALLTDVSREWPDLTFVMIAWPELPAPIRVGIVAMVKAAKP